MAGFEPGDLIYFAKPYAYVVDDDKKGEICDNCFKKQDGLKRCSQCLFMYFCNRECQTQAWKTHKAECKYIKNASPNFPTASLRLMAIVLFQIKKFGMDEPSETIYGHKMNFRRLVSHSNEIQQDLKASESMFEMLLALKPYIGKDNIPPRSEFIDIFGKVSVNVFSICDGDMQGIGRGLYLGPSIFDHSCEPDAEFVFDGIKINIRAAKKISHRDITQIHISYIEQLQLQQDRQKNLKDQYFFCCQCPRCTSSYHEDLMTNTLIDKDAAEVSVHKFKNHVDRIDQIKNEIGAFKTYKECLNVLKEQEGILADTHIYHVKILEIAFDVCIANKQCAEAIKFGKQLIKPYKLLYGVYHSVVGIHLFRLGKIQLVQETESAKTHLLQALEIF